MEKSTKEVLAFLEELANNNSGDIKVTCLDRKKVCKEGFCDATLKQELVKTKFSLVTGIISGADFLGSAKFGLQDVQEVSDSSVTVVIHDGKNTYKIKLEARE